jgi:anti-sigma B factor antagonist
MRARQAPDVRPFDVREAEASFLTRFEATVVHLNGTAVVRVRGDVDMETAPRLRAVVQGALRGCSRLVFDLRLCEFMDSSGLAVVIEAHRQLGQLREAVAVRGLRRSVRMAMGVSGVDQIVTIEDEEPAPSLADPG